jgi:hypothetical protein
MPLELLTETSMLPFVSKPGDWFHSYHPPSDEMVYIEHPVIIALMKHRGLAVIEDPPVPVGMEATGARWLVNAGEKYSDYGNAICESIVRWLQKEQPPRQHGTCMEFYLPEFPLPMILGWFGGKTFVFFNEEKIDDAAQDGGRHHTDGEQETTHGQGSDRDSDEDATGR